MNSLIQTKQQIASSPLVTLLEDRVHVKGGFKTHEIEGMYGPNQLHRITFNPLLNCISLQRRKIDGLRYATSMAVERVLDINPHMTYMDTSGLLGIGCLCLLNLVQITNSSGHPCSISSATD